MDDRDGSLKFDFIGILPYDVIRGDEQEDDSPCIDK